MKLHQISVVALALSSLAEGSVTFWEEVPYLSAQDSPFYEGIRAGTIFLEDFEDHELNTPYVVSWDCLRRGKGGKGKTRSGERAGFKMYPPCRPWLRKPRSRKPNRSGTSTETRPS